MLRIALRAKPLASAVQTNIRTPFELHRLKEGPQTNVQLSRKDALNYYTQLTSIRALERASAKLYRERAVRGFCHLYTGQEACAVGMRAAMRPNDNIISSYRVHGLAYLMGVSLFGVLAELTGGQSGCARGKGGSMHMYAPNFYGGNGIVGAQVPLGVGIAFASKYREEEAVCLTLYGDGAANQGQVAEAFNMACLLKLPVLFICENNNYSMGTRQERAAANLDYYKRGDLMPGVRADGMDVLAVRSAVEFAISHVRSDGPMVLELNTYRYSGHSMSDPGTSYRSTQEVDTIRRNRDPVACFRDLCLKLDVMTEEEAKEIKGNVKTEIEQAVASARTDPELRLQHLHTDVYAKNLEPKLRAVGGYYLEHIQERRGSYQ